eukprot:8671917-Lingulodinium_polyedra.AAC.1
MELGDITECYAAMYVLAVRLYCPSGLRVSTAMKWHDYADNGMLVHCIVMLCTRAVMRLVAHVMI